MKNQLTLVKSACAALLACTAGYAVAGGSQTLNTTATVTAVCKFTTGSAIALPFGNVDPSLAGPALATASVPFACTKGTADAAVTLTTGGTTLTLSPGVTMAYTLTTSALPTGTGFGAPTTAFTVTGTLPATSYQNAAAGTYTDTVTLTINH